MLSYIENGQFQLKKGIAIKLIDRLNFFINDSSQVIEYEYILEEPKKQIEKIIVYEIKNIKKFDLKKLDEFRSTFKKFNFYFEYIKLFFILGKNIKKTNISIAESLFEEILEISIDKNICIFLCNIVLGLQRMYSAKENFNKTLSLYIKVNKYISNSHKTILGFINYNFALALETNKNINQAIILYKKSLIQLENHNNIFYVKNNLSICYTSIGEYEKSKKIIFELLEQNLSDIEKSKCYSNLLMNAVHTKDFICIRITIPKLEVIIQRLKQANIVKYQSNYCLGRAYILLEDRYNAMINFEKELEIGIGDNRNHFFIDQYEYCIEQLATIYNITQKEKFKKLEKYILEIPKEKFNKDFFVKINLFFLRAYSYKEFYNFYEKVNVKLYGKKDVN